MQIGRLIKGIAAFAGIALAFALGRMAYSIVMSRMLPSSAELIGEAT